MEYTVELRKVEKQFELEFISGPENYGDILIKSKNVNRPAFQLTGYFERFDKHRIQIMGKTEFAYLNENPNNYLEEIFRRQPPLVVISRNIEVPEYMKEYSVTYGVPILRTNDTTSETLAALISYLNVQLAERIVRHGVFIEVYGEGILLVGDSAVGKSETAVELMKRGHRLIADDAVELRRVSRNTILGSSPENIRHFLELRGIGIINAKKLFGVAAVKTTEKVDLVIELENWSEDVYYDRLGIDETTVNILGIEIPSTLIPINPGRNLAIIIEVAAMNHRQKKLGYNSAQDLMTNLGSSRKEYL